MPIIIGTTGINNDEGPPLFDKPNKSHYDKYNTNNVETLDMYFLHTYSL